MHREQADRLRKEIAALELKRADEVRAAVKENADAVRVAGSISRSTSETTTRSKLREAERKQKKAAEHEGRAAKLAAQIATKHRALTTAEKRERDREVREARARGSARKREEQAAAGRRRTELQHARDLTREAERRSRLYSPRVTVEYVQRLPDTIKVLFVAANPRDQAQLLLDEEARDVTRRIRVSRFRDAVRLESIWAVRAPDLMEALNEHEPRIVHFSGHGSDADEIVFLDDDGNAKPVSEEAITATIATMVDHVRLVVFNTCYSHGQAEAATRHVDVAIGMTTSIGDEAARVFAGYFYGAIGSGHSVKRAFDQAIAGMKLEGIPEDETPELFARTGVDPDDVVLVRSDGMESLVA